jgi:hypothetical protein
LWKEAWLRRVGERAQPRAAGDAPTTELTTQRDGHYICQSTELAHASQAVQWWRVEQYARDVWTGNLTVVELVRSFAVSTVLHLRGRAVAGAQAITPSEATKLSPGELVRVKSRREIAATLDGRGCNRGLEFAPGMDEHCGRRHRVAGRIERMIDERSGKMRTLRNTVALDGIHCSGECARGCPRASTLFWREIWLSRDGGA